MLAIRIIIYTHEETPPKKVLVFAWVVVHIFKLIVESYKEFNKRSRSLVLIGKKKTSRIIGKNFPTMMKSIYQKLISNLNFPIEKLCTSLARALRPDQKRATLVCLLHWSTLETLAKRPRFLFGFFPSSLSREPGDASAGRLSSSSSSVSPLLLHDPLLLSLQGRGFLGTASGLSWNCIMLLGEIIFRSLLFLWVWIFQVRMSRERIPGKGKT